MEDYKPLPEDWITRGILDLEYKQYILLAYLQGVEKKFSRVELYPPLKDLVDHYHHLKGLQDAREQIRSKAPKELEGIDHEKYALIYKNKSVEEPWMSEIQKILDFSIPRIQENIEYGKVLYGEVEQSIRLEPIGILPIQRQEGYLFLWPSSQSFVEVFRYRISDFHYGKELIKGIYTHFVERIKKGLTTFENLKIRLIKKYQELPNPATYLVETERSYALEPTLLPVTKRLLLKEAYS